LHNPFLLLSLLLLYKIQRVYLGQFVLNSF
jgi:hypothetical protein